MQKKLFERINLTCVFQNTTAFEATEGNVSSPAETLFTGMLGPNPNGTGILFQETLPRRRDVRNAKIYEGEHVSLVRRKDGRYYPLLKAFRPEDVSDKSTLAFRIYSEISEALNVID